jgi:hypothetical protein
VAFEPVERVEGGDVEGGERSIAVGGVAAKIQRLALEVLGGELLNVAGDAVVGRISPADQGTTRVVDEPAEVTRAKVVDPLDRRARIGDDVLALVFVEVA